METNVSHRLSGCKILITGASGFLGSHLARKIHGLGADVYGTSRTYRRTSPFVNRWAQLDLLDRDALQDFIDRVKPDVLFHLAGHATAAPDRNLVLPTFQSLLLSTVNLLMAIRNGNCGRVVLIGSLTEPLPAREEVLAGSPYAAAIFSSSLYGRMFHGLYGVPVVIARPFMVYGPGQDPRKLIPYVTTSFLDKKAPRLSNGALEADWIYIDDVIQGLIAMVDTPGLEGTTFDLGSGTLTSVRNIVHHLIALTGTQIVPMFGALPDRPKEQVRIAKLEQAALRLDWKPTVSLVQGLQHTVAWIRQQRTELAQVVGTTVS